MNDFYMYQQYHVTVRRFYPFCKLQLVWKRLKKSGLTYEKQYNISIPAKTTDYTLIILPDDYVPNQTP